MKFREKENFDFRNTLQIERGERVVLKISAGEISVNSCRGKGKAQPSTRHEDEAVEQKYSSTLFQTQR